ncbi:MAG TPA: RNA 2',3'-cyclic phosphodiesterase [Rhodocyclaceae bacterium]|nr:RNA 2',3'-cyclic phosphodiesterase [Rhodocyclaceae bacterium]
MFFALWPAATVARRLHALARTLQRECGGRTMRTETLHLTLAFLGDQTPERVGESVEIARRIEFAPFTLRMDTVGCWMHNHIVWAGCTVPPPELAALAASLEAELGAARFPLDKRDFAPHMTLVRNALRRPAPRPFDAVSWDVGELVLVVSQRKSDGAHYRVLERRAAKK